MWPKFFVFSLIISILITYSETQSLRGARNYGEELPATRSGILKKNKLANNTSGDLNTQTTQFMRGKLDWEPLACSECLNERYLAHYLQRGCKPVDNGLFCKKPCPKYFECPKRNDDIVVDGCEYKGKVYKYRESIEHENPCKQGCFCDQNLDQNNVSRPQITCAHVDCFNNFRMPAPNCFPIYEDKHCCPTEKCLTKEELALETKCLYDGNQYHSGQRIHLKEDPCVECVCGEGWNQTNPLKSKGCKTTQCDIDSGNDKQGCIPIYHEGVCCPIEYFCPPKEEEQCKFNGRNYLIGETLQINKERTECKCLIPPDFTCIQKILREESPPTPTKVSTDYIKEFQTLPKINITNSTNIPLLNIPDLNAKTKCPPFLANGLICAGENCITIIDENGCQACKCETPCPQLKCRKGCSLVATTPGVCPKCDCPST